MDLNVQTSKGVRGTVGVPGDKSISHRALLIGALAEGLTEIRGLSEADDPRSTEGCLRDLGVGFQRKKAAVLVRGKGLRGLRRSKKPLDAGNSGTTIRLLSGILAGQRFDSQIAGDDSLNRRPMKRILEPLRMMGARISGTPNDTAPLQILAVDHLHPIQYTLPDPSAQVKSAVLLAGLFSDGTTQVREPIPTRDHTERMLRLETKVKDGVRVVEVRGGAKIEGQRFMVPGDLSAASFLIVAALLVPNSELRLTSVGLNPTRTAVLEILKSMGASLEIVNQLVVGGEPIGDIIARSSDLNAGIELSGRVVASLIDEIPILAVAALFAEGTFRVRDAMDLRTKESDRIAAIVNNARRLGSDVEEYPDGFAFRGKKNLIGAEVDSYFDHRIAMAFGVAGLVIPNTTIRNADCVGISFPRFWETLHSISP